MLHKSFGSRADDKVVPLYEGPIRRLLHNFGRERKDAQLVCTQRLFNKGKLGCCIARCAHQNPHLAAKLITAMQHSRWLVAVSIAYFALPQQP